ncbi:MAG: DUF3098 domain-containing protein [Balneolales bacterium]|nr:DUF3098 domain-containing protein [Balneolales bacterium]
MPRPTKRNRVTNKKEEPIFTLLNYKIMGSGAGLIFLGFAIMALERQIDGFLSLFISPILILSGFVLFGYGIMKKEETVAP